MVVIIDNYDSFTFNLYQLFATFTEKVEVVKNDTVSLQALRNYNPSYLVISPGPGRPQAAGISIEAINFYKDKIPILGVCLGHQAIVAAFGGEIKKAGRLMHGKLSTVTHNGKGIFADIPQKFKAMRYHSLIAEEENLPSELGVTAKTPEGEVMGIEHIAYPIYGLQFHPEAYLTEYGTQLIRNFLCSGTKKALLGGNENV